MLRLAGLLLVLLLPAILAFTRLSLQDHGNQNPRLPDHTIAPPSCSSHPPCSSLIYCSGDLLHVVQLSGLFNDSKTFVDMPTRFPPAKVLANFALLPPQPSEDELQAFLDENFYEAGSDLLEVEPLDWVEEPPFLALVQDREARVFAKDVHARWKQLYRKFNHEFSCIECFSSISLPHPFIVPGGRFREAYYWDTYWAVKGLLVSDMVTTVKGIITNFVYMVNSIGFIPNGSRIYYLNRSQPPFLTRIVWAYLKETQDVEYLASIIATLDKEYSFFDLFRSVELLDEDGNTHRLNVYSVTNDVPRPESYLEDIEMAEHMEEERQKEFYAHISSGAESGWDFSSRWFEGQTLETILVKEIVPVDLNAILYDVEVKLSEFHTQLGNTDKATYYQAQSEKRRLAMDSFFWDEEGATWRDYNFRTRQQIPGFYGSAVYPLWAKAHNKSPEQLSRVVKEASKHLQYLCGVPSSEFPSGEQWDYPNAWAPLQDVMIEGLEAVADVVPEAALLAERLALTWLDCNFCGWNATGGLNGGDMFEKYDVDNKGIPGGGGEYDVQLGFGWTNGVVLDLLERKGNTFKPTKCNADRRKLMQL